MTRFDKLALAPLVLGALAVAPGEPAVAEVRPAAVGAVQSAPRVLEFRVLLREYLEFRVGSQVTIRSNAGQVVITASDPRERLSADAGTTTAPDPVAAHNAARSSAEPKPGNLMPPAAVVADADRIGTTNVCLYLEGSVPACGDLSEVAGRVIYTASNP